MTHDAAGQGSRWPAALVALLAIPFDPWWIDFEAARRGLLLLLLGVFAIARPRSFATRAFGSAAMFAIAAWLLLSGLANGDSIQFAAAAERCLWWASLFLLCRAGAGTDKTNLFRVAMLCAAATASVGIAQRLGLPFWIGNVEEPVSLFGNRNVAAEFLAVAGACVAARHAQMPRCALLTLFTCGAYAAANGSRSGLVALPFGVAVACAFAKGTEGRIASPRRWTPVLSTLAGMGLGLLCLASPASPSATASVPGATTTEQAQPTTSRTSTMPGATTRTATLEVRVEIAKSALTMLSDAPVLGHGPGQFAVQYPRYRSQREIELSSLSRAEMRRVGTAHDDWLETAIEGGVPALLLLLAFFGARLARGRFDADAAPLVALAALMVVRAPLLNAPTVALALLFAARRNGSNAFAPSRWHEAALRVLGAMLLGVGISVSAASFCAARFLESIDADGTGDAKWLARANAAHPSDPSCRQLWANEILRTAVSRADAERALEQADVAVSLRPFEPSYRLLRADLLRFVGRTQEAKRELAEVAKLDPGEPQVQIQLAGLYATEGDFDAALVALATDPPPPLREKLAAQLEQLSEAARAAQKPEAASRLLAECAFVRTLDALGEATARGDVLAKARFDEMRARFAEARLDADLRPLLLLAVLSQRTGQASNAEQAGLIAQKRAASLPAWQWSLLRELARPLREVPSWKSLLPQD